MWAPLLFQSSNLQPGVREDILVDTRKYLTNKNKKTPWPESAIPTERPPLVGEVSANFCG
jgi:hypothetical protein